MCETKMLKIGLLGGMAWPSTLEYYRIINETVNLSLGGTHSAEILLDSLDMAVIEAMQQQEKWDELGAYLRYHADVFLREVDFILICSNTMHKVAETLEVGGHKILHIADTVGTAIQNAGLKKVGLLGTRFTMKETFYRERLAQMGIETVIPSDEACQEIDRIIFEELCRNEILGSSKMYFLAVISDLVRRQGVEGVILGCTEIPLLVMQGDTDIPLFNALECHATAAAEQAISQYV